MLTFVHQKECTCCNNIYSRKDVTEQQFQPLEEQVCETEEGHLEVKDTVSIVTTNGCCPACFNEGSGDE